MPPQEDVSTLLSVPGDEFVAYEDDNQANGELPWTVPTMKELMEQRARFYSDEEKTLAWSETADIVKAYSDEMIQRWKEEIDTLLVFAGLFSAILTAFNVQSYILLQPPSDPTLAALQTISAQLHSFSTVDRFINSTNPIQFDAQAVPPNLPPALWVIWLNIAWFSGLILSLSSAVIGITVKQWINVYLSGISGTSREIARLRQYRLNGLIKWRVAAIVTSLPILLQLALALFLTGLLILLWNLHTTVASVASVLVGLLILFSVGTTVLPLLHHDCAYLSPLSLALFFLWEQLKFIPRWAWHWLKVGCASILEYASRLLSTCNHWESGRRVASLASRIRPAFWKTPTPALSWRGREQLTVGGSSMALDVNLVTIAYTTTMDPERLNAAATCFTDLPSGYVLDCFEALHSASMRCWGGTVNSIAWPKPSRPEIWADGLFECLQRQAQFSPSIHGGDEGELILPLWFYDRVWSTSLASWNIQTRGWLLSTLSSAALCNQGHALEIERQITEKMMLEQAVELGISLGDSVHSAARAAELWLRRPHDASFPMNHLHRVEILVLCSVQPDLEYADRAAIQTAAKHAVAELPTLAQKCCWDMLSDVALGSLGVFAKHGRDIASAETAAMFECFLNIYEHDPEMRGPFKSDKSGQYTEELATLKANLGIGNDGPGKDGTSQHVPNPPQPESDKLPPHLVPLPESPIVTPNPSPPSSLVPVLSVNHAYEPAAS